MSSRTMLLRLSGFGCLGRCDFLKRVPSLFFPFYICFLNVKANISLFIGCFIWWVLFVCFVSRRAFQTNLHLCCNLCAINVHLPPLCWTRFIHLWVSFGFQVVPRCPFTLLYVKHLTVNLILVFLLSLLLLFLHPIHFQAQVHLSSVSSWLMICVNVVRVHIVFSLKKKEKKNHQRKCNSSFLTFDLSIAVKSSVRAL